MGSHRRLTQVGQLCRIYLARRTRHLILVGLQDSEEKLPSWHCSAYPINVYKPVHYRMAPKIRSIETNVKIFVWHIKHQVISNYMPGYAIFEFLVSKYIISPGTVITRVLVYVGG